MYLKPDPPPVDPDPEEGDTVIEIKNGVPHISTHHEKPQRGMNYGTRSRRKQAARRDPAYYSPPSPKGE